MYLHWRRFPSPSGELVKEPFSRWPRLGRGSNSSRSILLIWGLSTSASPGETKIEERRDDGDEEGTSVKRRVKVGRREVGTGILNNFIKCPPRVAPADWPTAKALAWSFRRPRQETTQSDHNILSASLLPAFLSLAVTLYVCNSFVSIGTAIIYTLLDPGVCRLACQKRTIQEPRRSLCSGLDFLLVDSSPLPAV